MTAAELCILLYMLYYILLHILALYTSICILYILALYTSICIVLNTVGLVARVVQEADGHRYNCSLQGTFACMRPQATSVCDLKPLVYEALT